MTSFIILMCTIAAASVFAYAVVYLLGSEEGPLVLCDGIGEEPQEGILRIWPQDNRIAYGDVTVGEWEVRESQAWATGMVKHSPWTTLNS